MNSIKLTLLSILILVLFNLGCSPELPHKTTWEGKLEGVRLVLKLSKDDVTGITGAEYDSPDEGAFARMVSKLRITEDSLYAYSSVIKGGFSGRFNSDKTELSGIWEQGSKAFPLVLKRVEIKRPQTPKSPAPYREERIVYHNKNKSIQYGATLTYPKAGKVRHAVILISGSGQQDRDETLFDHQPFWVIADHLTRNGIAVLRVDDRGVGLTTGNVGDATSLDFADDVLAGLGYLQSHPSLRPEKIGLIGHSEGGMIAPLAANQSADVAFIISMAGPGIKGSDLLLRQAKNRYRKMGLNQDEIGVVADWLKNISMISERYPEKDKRSTAFQIFMKDWLKNQPDTLLSKVGFKGPEANKRIDAIAGAHFAPWMRYFLQYDPANTLTKIRIPVLALNGGKDVQVYAEENLEGFEKWLTAAGNKNFKTVLLPDLNHMFQHAVTGEISEYGTIEETIAPEVLTILTDWIKER